MSEAMALVGALVWPAVALICFLVAWPAITRLLGNRVVKIKIAGQEIEMGEAASQQQSLIDDMQGKLLELEREKSNNQENIKAAQNDDVPTFKKYEFTGDDLGLQETRCRLADAISRIFETDLSQSGLEQVQQLTISQHNDAWNYEIGEEQIPKHIEEADALYYYLSNKLIYAPNSAIKGKFASALGIMKNNMKGRTRTLRRA